MGERELRISDAEWQVMEVVWEKAPVAASAVAEVLADKQQWALATVRTLLRRLVSKGAIEQQLDGKRLLYRPRVSAADCVRRESLSFLDRVLGRTPSETILHLVKETDLSNADIEKLRRILREKEKNQ